MSSEENKVAVRRFIETTWTQHDMAEFDDFFADASGFVLLDLRKWNCYTLSCSPVLF